MNAKQGLTDRGTSHDFGRTGGNMYLLDFPEEQNDLIIGRIQIPADSVVPKVARAKHEKFVNRFLREHVKLIKHKKCDLAVEYVTD